MATFKESFAAARKAGKKEFTWNGKRYNTKLREEGQAKQTPKNAPKPTSAPRGTSGATRSARDKAEAGRVKKVTDEARREVSRSGASRSTSGKTSSSPSLRDRMKFKASGWRGSKK